MGDCFLGFRLSKSINRVWSVTYNVQESVSVKCEQRHHSEVPIWYDNRTLHTVKKRLCISYTVYFTSNQYTHNRYHIKEIHKNESRCEITKQIISSVKSFFPYVCSCTTIASSYQKHLCNNENKLDNRDCKVENNEIPYTRVTNYKKELLNQMNGVRSTRLCNDMLLRTI